MEEYNLTLTEADIKYLLHIILGDIIYNCSYEDQDYWKTSRNVWKKLDSCMLKEG